MKNNPKKIWHEVVIGCKPHGRISHTVRKPTTQTLIPSTAVALPVEHLPQKHMFETTLAYAVGTELCYLGFRERATPVPHSLKYDYRPIENYLYKSGK